MVWVSVHSGWGTCLVRVRPLKKFHPWLTFPNARIDKERRGPGGGLENSYTYDIVLLTYS